MARTVTMKVDGLRELGEKFDGLSEEMQKRVARDATGVASGLVKKSAQAKAPVRTGLLKSQIITKRIPPGQARSLGVTSMHIVTVRQGRKRRKGKNDKGSAPHAHLLEYGTVHMAPRPFLRPALDENVQASISAMASVLRAHLAKLK